MQFFFSIEFTRQTTTMYAGLKAKQLKALCAEQGLAVSGKKSALVERLTTANSGAPAMETENAAPNPNPGHSTRRTQ